MKILPIISNQLYNKQNVYLKKDNVKKSSAVFQSIKYDTVSFCASKASGEPLRKLAEYGIPDMYTGNPMLSWNKLSQMMNNGDFELPLKKLVPILKKYEGTMLDTEHKIFKILEHENKIHPNRTMEDVLKHQFQEHQRKLLNKQRPIFERLVEKACDLPYDVHQDFMELMRMTSKRIAKDLVVFHFSENEFLYKLKQIEKQIKTKNNRKETQDIRILIKEATKLFKLQAEEKKKFGKGFSTRDAKMEYQMQPHILKRNTQSIQNLRTIFENSSIRDNRELKNLFRITSAKICGFPVVEPFKRKEFIYDLKNVLKFIDNKKLRAELVKIAHELPTSTQDVSAFMVKHVNDSPGQIGWYLMKGSLVSIEHIYPKKRRVKSEELEEAVKKKKSKKKKNNVSGGLNHVNNYGLSAAGINKLRSNMPFDEWVREHPESYQTIPTYFNRIIELYYKGIFSKVGLDKSYIFEFAKNIAKLSPQEKPIILDTSMVK